MGFFEELLGLFNRPDRKVVAISPEEYIKEQEEFGAECPNKALGMYLKKKVKDHIENKESYIIGIDRVATCMITKFGHSDKTGSVIRKHVSNFLNDGGFCFIFPIVHDDNRESVSKTESKAFVVSASEVDWLADIEEEELYSACICFTFDSVTFYNRVSPFFRQYKLDLPDMEQVKNQDMNVDKKGRFNLLSYFFDAIICRGSTISYATSDGLRFLIPDKLFLEPQKLDGFESKEKALECKDTVPELTWRKPRTFRERHIKRMWIAMTRGFVPFSEDKPWETDWNAHSKARIKCEKCNFVCYFPVTGIVQEGLLRDHYGIHNHRFCNKCDSLFVKKNKTYVLRFQSDFWKEQSKDISLVQYLQDHTYIGDFDKLKTCICGGELARVSNCPKCDTKIKIESPSPLIVVI